MPLADVPALPDTERRTTYSVTTVTKGPFAVGFHIYADGEDYANWIEVWIDDEKVTSGWALSSASGSLANLPRPITNAVIEFDADLEGSGGSPINLQIVGTRRPRRLSQFGTTLPPRTVNRVITDITATEREIWDKLKRTLLAPPGETFGPLQGATQRAGGVLGFDGAGDPSILQNLPSDTGRVPQADIEMAIYKTADRIEDVSVSSVYDYVLAGGFRWKRKLSAAGTWDRTSLDGAVWQLDETDIYPEIWGDALTGRNPEDTAQDDAAAINAMLNYARSVANQSASSNPTKPLVMNLRAGAHYVVKSTIDAAGMTWNNVIFEGNGATIWGKCRGKPVLDGVGTMNAVWNNFTIRGDKTDRPSVGMQIGREHTDASRSNHHFEGVKINGFYTKTAYVNSACEVLSYRNCSFTNRDNKRSSYSYAIDSNNSMDLDTESANIVSNHDGLWFSSVNLEPGTNWASNEIVLGLTSGARRRRRTRRIGNLMIGVEHVTSTTSPYFGLTNSIPFVIGETVAGQTSGKTGVLSRVSKWARQPGDDQSCTAISHLDCDFRKVDALGQQRGTGYAVAFFASTGETGGQIKQIFFRNCYAPVADCASVRVDGNLFNTIMELHCETSQPVGQAVTLTLVVVNGSGNPITNLSVGETLTGVTSGVTAVVAGYVDDDTDFPGDQVRVTTTAAEVALPGTVTTVAGSQALVGVGTNFLTSLARLKRVKIVQTGEELVIQSVTDNLNAVLSLPATQDSSGSAIKRLDSKFLLGETVNASVSGAAVGTVDSGYGPRHMFEVVTNAQVWLEDFELRDHNPHAFEYVIAKKNASALTMTNSRIFMRATHWDVQIARPSSTGWGPIDYHGQAFIGEGGAQQTTKLKDLSSFRRLDAIVFAEAGTGGSVILPSAGDAIVLASGSNLTVAESLVNFSGYVRGNVAWKASVNVATAATCPIWAAKSNRVSLTGTTQVDAFDTAPFGGAHVLARATGSFLLKNNASIEVQGGADYQVQVGDHLLIYASATTVSRVIIFPASGNEAVGLLRGINVQTVDYTAVLTDAGKLIRINSGTAKNLTIPPNSSVAFPVNSWFNLSQAGAGQVTVVAGAGVTLRSRVGLKTGGQYAVASAIKIATDEWLLSGDLTP